jgi:hypothetical protein
MLNIQILMDFKENLPVVIEKDLQEADADPFTRI